MASRVRPEDVTWEVLLSAVPVLDDVRSRMTHEDFAADKRALQEFLCNYFSAGECRHKQGESQISPMKSTHTAAGGKCLKVRWATPGSGKSGGLRLAVVVYCEAKRVRIAGAWLRKDDPSDDQVQESLKGT